MFARARRDEAAARATGDLRLALRALRESRALPSSRRSSRAPSVPVQPDVEERYVATILSISAPPQRRGWRGLPAPRDVAPRGAPPVRALSHPRPARRARGREEQEAKR